MEFKELTKIWKQSDIQQDTAIKINHQLIKEVGLNKVKTNIQEIKWSAIFEIIIEVLFSGFLINFLNSHQGNPAFTVPAGIILALVLLNVIFEVYRLRLYYSINPDDAVLKAQKNLSHLKKLEIFDIYSLLVIIPVFGLLFIIVLAKALLDIDLYQFGTGWMVQFSAGSIVVAIVLVLILRKYPNKKLRDAIKFIDELREK